MANSNAAVAIAIDNDASAMNQTPEERTQNMRMVEALVFASSDPLSAADIAARLPEGTDVAGLLRDLVVLYAERGVNLQAVLRDWLGRVRLAGSVRLQVDIDPYSFL